MERNIDGLCCLRRIFEPWQWKRRKKEKSFLNRRPELYRGKYRCVQPKDQLVKKDVFLCLCENNVFPVEPSGCRRKFSSGLHGNTAADSVQSEWAVVYAAKSKTHIVFARRRIELRTETKTFEKNFAEKERKKKGERERCASRALPSEYHRQTYL
ncbi:hypothetical protein TNCV_4094471 [Trichonephila clavipes]|nr:hypothetical protein TNCV_4094471 [Trichonephila clavipes]